MTRSQPDDPAGAEASGRPRLRRIDDALVPGMQRTSRAIGRVAGWPARALRALDGRLAGGRPARAVHQHRGLAALLIVGIGFGAAVVHFQRFPELRARAQEATAAAPGGDAGVVDQPSASPRAGAFGPLVGARVDPYLQARDDALALAPAGEVRVAVVSFDQFVTPAGAADAVGDLDTLAVQYQLPERTPRPARVEVDGSLAGTMDQLVADLLVDLRQEEQDTASTIETTEDEAFRADFEARLDELVAMRNTLARDPRIVFAVVVRGPVDQLQAVAASPGTRLVDLVPADVTDEAATRADGVLPTDRDRFTYGRGT